MLLSGRVFFYVCAVRNLQIVLPTAAKFGRIFECVHKGAGDWDCRRCSFKRMFSQKFLDTSRRRQRSCVEPKRHVSTGMIWKDIVLLFAIEVLAWRERLARSLLTKVYNAALDTTAQRSRITYDLSPHLTAFIHNSYMEDTEKMLPHKPSILASSSSKTSTSVVLVSVMCHLVVLSPVTAWMAAGGGAIARVAWRGNSARVLKYRTPLSAQMSAGSSSPDDRAKSTGRKNLLELRKDFERSMDGKLIMEYVKVSRGG